MIQENENTVNVYSTLITSLNKHRIAKFFSKSGWLVRKSGHNEYEIESESAELEIYGSDKEILMSGIVKNYKSTISGVIDLLQQHSIDYQIECYDQSDKLLVEYKNS